MLAVDVDLLPSRLSAPPEVAVAVDVLRMTTTAATLIEAGAATLLVVASVEEARRLAAAEGALLLGERGGLPPAGFDGGNSPLAVHGLALGGRSVVVCTSNGSAAVEALDGAATLLLGSIRNAAAVAEAALAAAERDVRLVCAGTDGRPSLDDLLGAACIVEALLALEPRVELGEGARLARTRLRGAGPLDAALRDCRHGRILEGLGFGDDIAFAADLDASRAVPRRLARAPASFGR